MSEIRVKAVLAGFAVDVLGSAVIGVVLGVAMGVVAATRHVGQAEMRAMRLETAPQLVGLLGTTLSTFLGGYVAGRISYPFSVKNAGAVGAVSLVLSITLATLLPGITPLWKLVAGAIVTIPAALAGGWAAATGRSVTQPPTMGRG